MLTIGDVAFIGSNLLKRLYKVKRYLAETTLDLTIALDSKETYLNADFVVIVVPANYDNMKFFFDTNAVEDVIKLTTKYNLKSMVVIKSMILTRHTKSSCEKRLVKT